MIWYLVVALGGRREGAPYRDGLVHSDDDKSLGLFPLYRRPLLRIFVLCALANVKFGEKKWATETSPVVCEKWERNMGTEHGRDSMRTEF